MRKGFTLIELLVVIVILGVVASIVAVSVLAKAERARWDMTVTAVQRVKMEVELHKAHQGRLPERLADLVASGQMEALPKDGWGREFHYEKPGRRGAAFDVVSYGADDLPGGTGVDEDIWSHPPK